MAIKDDDLLYVQRPSGLDAGSYKTTVGDLLENAGGGNYLSLDADAGAQTVESPGEVTFKGGLDLRGTIAGDPDGFTVTHGIKGKSIFSADCVSYVQYFSQPDLDNQYKASTFLAHFEANSLRNVPADFEPLQVCGFDATPVMDENHDGTKLSSNIEITGFRSDLASSGSNNVFAIRCKTAPSFSEGDFHIGGSTARNTFELWRDSLSQEQLEQYKAGTLSVPFNVENVGNGEFARFWWYERQSEETQQAIQNGEVDFPEQFAAETFTDTFALGDNTKIQLKSNGDLIAKNFRIDLLPELT